MDAIDVMKVSRLIEQKIGLLEKGRDGLEPLAHNKAQALSDYDKALKIAILTLREKGNLPVTLIEKVAKGECHLSRRAMDLADALYKIQIVKMDAVQAELNGYQSINRHLEVR